MTVYDLTIAKISQMPESLVQEVNDFIDFLLLKYNSELPKLTESDFSEYIDRANLVSPHTIIAPFTTKIRRALLPSHELITEAQRALRKEAQSKIRKN